MPRSQTPSKWDETVDVIVVGGYAGCVAATAAHDAGASVLLLEAAEDPGEHCQSNLNRPAKGAGPRRSGRQLTPLGQGGGTVLSEDVAVIEVTVLIEMIMDRGMDGGKLLQSLYVPELRHCTFSSSERLM